jgi:hypothetical protein
MNANIEQITKSIINLSKKERLEIARLILFLDNQTSDSNADSLWEKEITDRVRSVEEGVAVGVDYHQAIAEIDTRF